MQRQKPPGSLESAALLPAQPIPGANRGDLVYSNHLGVDYIERRGQTVSTPSPKVNVDIAPFHPGTSWRQNAQTG